MTVTKLEPVTKTRYKVFLDECFVFTLYKGEVLRYGIKEGATLEENVYKEILETVVMKRAKLRAMHLLESRDYTEAGLLEKLKVGGYPEEATEVALEYVKSFGYLDDLRYAKHFTESRRQTKSRREIFALLRRKGVESELIGEVLDKLYDTDSEKEAIKSLIKKKGMEPTQLTEGAMNKLYGYLSRKGFHYDNIRQVIQSYKENT